MHSVPNSRLLLKSKALVDNAFHQRYIDMFSKHGIDKTRIELVPWTQSTREHYLLYNRIDIALDTFPYNGTTTTCEALWMGVPVITASGNRHASRVGCSLLSNTGMHNLIALTEDDFVDIALSMANDITRLSSMRSTLREQLLNSTLCDKGNYCIKVENAYRNMWSNWRRNHQHLE